MCSSCHRAKAVLKDKPATSTAASAGVETANSDAAVTAADEPVMTGPAHNSPPRDEPVIADPVSQEQHQEPPADVVMDEEPPAAASPKPVEGEDDVVVTHTQHSTPPKTSTVLVKTTAEHKPAPSHEPAHDAHLEAYEDMGLSSLHQEYVTQLARHHDAEGAIVTLMKKKI